MIARLFEWFISSPPATIITALAAIIGAFRVQSNFEHRKTLGAIQGVSNQVNGGLLERIDRIERKLDLHERDETR